jgi:hypothetical protein
MLLVRRLAKGRRRPLPTSALLLRSSGLSSSTATALCSSWSPLDSDHPPPTAAADAGAGSRKSASSDYDLSRARVLEVESPFVHADRPRPPVKVCARRSKKYPCPIFQELI